ncbi:MAG: VWA domain-containing protein, partial [Planctomycetes bacterium]|nr:VWA domain-containing protein [Planctomycetota bacterium]
MDSTPHIESTWRLVFLSPWATSSALTVPACLTFCAIAAFLFYFRRDGRLSHPPSPVRIRLATLRSIALSLLVLVLADLNVETSTTRLKKPQVWVLLDGSDSMSIRDHATESHSDDLPTRADLVRSFLTTAPASVDHESSLIRSNPKKQTRLQTLEDRFDLTLFSFGEKEARTKKGAGTVAGTGLRVLRTTVPDSILKPTAASSFDKLPVSAVPKTESQNRQNLLPDLERLLHEWSPDAPETAIGDALLELEQLAHGNKPAGLIIFSDFNHNLGRLPTAAARQLQVPILTIGVGPETAADLSVEITSASTIKAGESTTVTVLVHQSQLERESVQVRLMSRSARSPSEQESANVESNESLLIGEKSIVLDGPNVPVEFSWTAQSIGVNDLIAEVSAHDKESVVENNKAERKV